MLHFLVMSLVDSFLGEMTIKKCGKLEYFVGRHPSGGRSTRTHTHTRGILSHSFDFCATLLRNALTDLVLHRSDSAIRHPVHLIRQLYRHQPPTGNSRSAVRRQLRDHGRLGLRAALVPQVLRTEKAQGRTYEGNGASIVLTPDGMDRFCAMEGGKCERTANRDIILVSPLNRVASKHTIDRHSAREPAFH